MCHLSMKLSDKFDPNQMYTSDKIVVKHFSVKETLLKLDLKPKGQGYSKQQNNKQGNKNIPHVRHFYQHVMHKLIVFISFPKKISYKCVMFQNVIVQ